MHELKTLIDHQFIELTRTARQSIRAEVEPNPRLKGLVGDWAAGAENNGLAVVTGINTNAKPYLTGDITISGQRGLVATQEQSTIKLSAPQVLAAGGNLLDLQHYQLQTPQKLQCINLVRFVTNGWLVVNRLRLGAAIVAGKSPNTNEPIIDLAVYSLTAKTFVRKIQVGPKSFNDLQSLGGITKYLAFAPPPTLDQGEYWLAWQFYGAATTDYQFALAGMNSNLISSQSYQVATNTNDPLPATLPQPSQPLNCEQWLWFELD